jgi:hypothetical protein
MLRRHIVFATIVVCLVGSPGASEIYKYVDENGVVHFTDDRAKISNEVTPKVYGERAYGCDNVAVVGGSPCFTKDDDRYMTVALKSRPFGDTIHRIKDPGDGVRIVVRQKTDTLNETWLLVAAGDKVGWIHSAFVRQVN